VGAVTLSWTAPVNNGGSPITSYTVTATVGGFHCSTTTNTCKVVGLTKGTAYVFKVVAINAAGTSVASVATVSVKAL
jgi:hypothetical protein